MTVARRVDFLANQNDLLVLVLGGLGFGTRFIAARCGLTEAQVLYRLRKGGVKRADYRGGTGPLVKTVLESVRPAATEQTRKRVARK